MDIFDKTADILKGLSGVDTVNTDDKLVEDLSLDSLGMVSFIIEAEEEFGIEFDQSDMNPYELITVLDAVDLIYKYCAGGVNEK